MSSKNSCSQSAPVPKALVTTRTTQVPPDCASTRNSLTSGRDAVALAWPASAAQSGSS